MVKLLSKDEAFSLKRARRLNERISEVVDSALFREEVREIRLDSIAYQLGEEIDSPYMQKIEAYANRHAFPEDVLTVIDKEIGAYRGPSELRRECVTDRFLEPIRAPDRPYWGWTKQISSVTVPTSHLESVERSNQNYHGFQQ